MSKEALSSFLKKVAEDPALQDKLIEFAAKHGFEFTAEELSEADLENIAGGPSRRPEEFIAAQQVEQMKITPTTGIDPKIP
jgi:predicted ribosomally synthesized peptide with nif11-like leader